MNAIREYADKVGHKVVGKLTRIPDKELMLDGFTGEMKRTKAKFYVDEGGNEYWVSKNGVCIVDFEGGVI